MERKIKIVCCVCRKKVQSDEGEWVSGTFDEEKDKNLSHGYCPECSKKVREEFRLTPRTKTNQA